MQRAGVLSRSAAAAEGGAQRGTEGVNVRGRRPGADVPCLGRGERRACGGRLGVRFGDRRREAEVCEHGLAGVAEQDVARLHVAVQQAAGVHGSQHAPDRPRERDHLRGGQPPLAAQPVGQRAAQAQLGDEVRSPAVQVTAVVDAQDVPLARQPPHDRAFAFEAPNPDPLGLGVPDHLDGHPAVELLLVAAVDDAEPALVEHGEVAHADHSGWGRCARWCTHARTTAHRPQRFWRRPLFLLVRHHASLVRATAGPAAGVRPA